MINTLVIAGIAAADPTVKVFTGGTSMTSLLLTVSRRYKDKTGAAKVEAGTIEVEAFGTVGMIIVDQIGKGSSVCIEGHLKVDSWEYQGRQMTKLKVMADAVYSMSTAKDTDETGTTPIARTPQAPAQSRPAATPADEPPF